MLDRIQCVRNHVIVAAAGGHKVLRTAIFSETQAPVGCKARYPW